MPCSGSIEWAAIPAKSARAAGSRKATREPPRRQDRRQSEPGEEERVSRRADDRAEERREQRTSAGKRLEQPPAGRRVATEPGCRGLDGALEDDRSSGVGERHRGGWMYPFQPVVLEVPAREERRRDPERVRGAHGSWMNPGRVSSADLDPPPTRSAAS